MKVVVSEDVAGGIEQAVRDTGTSPSLLAASDRVAFLGETRLSRSWSTGSGSQSWRRPAGS